MRHLWRINAVVDCRDFFRRAIVAGQRRVSHGIANCDGVGRVFGCGIVQHVGDKRLEAFAAGTRGRQKMLGSNTRTASRLFYREGCRDVRAAVVGVDHVDFFVAQLLYEDANGGPVHHSCFCDGQNRKSQRRTAFGQGMAGAFFGFGAGKCDFLPEIAECATEVEHVALGAGEDIGIRVKENLQFFKPFMPFGRSDEHSRHNRRHTPAAPRLRRACA